MESASLAQRRGVADGRGIAIQPSQSYAEIALMAAAQEKPDFAVIDWKLAGEMDGLVLARKLNQWQVGSIFASTYSHGAEAAEGTAIGFMPKPYEPDHLVAAIELALCYWRGEPIGDLPDGFRLFKF